MPIAYNAFGPVLGAALSITMPSDAQPDVGPAFKDAASLRESKPHAVISSASPANQSALDPLTNPRYLHYLVSLGINNVATLNALDRLGDLARDWDGYGSPPIAPENIESAKRFLYAFADQIGMPPSVVPMSEGRLQFEWNKGPRSLEFEFEDPFFIHYLKWDSSLGIEEEDIISPNDREKLIGLMRWFGTGGG